MTTPDFFASPPMTRWPGPHSYPAARTDWGHDPSWGATPWTSGLAQDECSVCGWQPAELLSLHRVTGWILFFRVRTTSAVFCRECADSARRDAQAHNLARGWWTLLAGPLVTLWALAANEGALRRHRRSVGTRMRRRPGLVSPSAFPSSSRPILRRWGAVLGLIVATAWLAFGVWTAVAQAGTTPATPSVPCFVGSGTSL